MNRPDLAPVLAIEKAEDAIEFYRAVFDAEEIERYQRPDGFIDHAELKIGNSILMLAGFDEQFTANPAGQEQGSVLLHLTVDNIDKVFERAVGHGAEVRVPVSDQFYGHRSGRFQDPFGHIWVLAQVVKEMSPKEMQEAYGAMFEGG
jgi:PhnB protein